MTYAIAKLDFDEGLAFTGPFPNKYDAHAFLDTTGMHTETHCEVVELHPRAFGAEWLAPVTGDESHAILTGTLAGGYKLYGPFPSLEAAESVSGDLPEYAFLVPLIVPAY